MSSPLIYIYIPVLIHTLTYIFISSFLGVLSNAVVLHRRTFVSSPLLYCYKHTVKSSPIFCRLLNLSLSSCVDTTLLAFGTSHYYW